MPPIVRPYVTAYANMCWGAGILLSSGVVRAVASIDGDWGWRLPFVIQWVWPVPLIVAAYIAPESPWNSVRRHREDEARASLKRLRQHTPGRDREVDAALALIVHTMRLEAAETEGSTIWDCFRGTNLRRTEIVSQLFSRFFFLLVFPHFLSSSPDSDSRTTPQNCVIWSAQILCGNAILAYAVVFLEAAGFSELQAFDVNISLSACYIIGGMVCWTLFPRFGRATIYMSGLLFMFLCLVAIGGLGFSSNRNANIAISVLLILSTLCNMMSIGPVCYPIVSEMPSGRLRYKTIAIGRFVYNLVGIFANSVTPRMISSLCEFCSASMLTTMLS